MKKSFLLFVFALWAFAGFAQTPIVLYDFENSEATTGGYGGVQTNEPNPDASGINTSANVLKWVPGAAEVSGSWNSAIQHWFGNYDFSNVKEIKMKVYFPADANNFRPELKNETEGLTIADTWVTPTVSTWTQITLDLSSLTIATDEDIQLYFWFNPNGTTAGPFYIDDIELMPYPDAPVVNSAKLVSESQVKVTFSKDMNDPTGKTAEFGITINSVGATISSLTQDASNDAIYIFDIAEKAVYGDDLTISYTAGTVQSTDANTLESISYKTLKNGLYKTLTIDKLAKVPTIDGVADLIWGKVTAMGIDTIIMNVDGSTPAATDISATFKAAYNDTAFFYLIEVSDENLQEVATGSASPWNYDNIELYISANNSQAESFQTGDMNLRLNINSVSQKTTNTQAIMKETTGGYTYEVCVPYADIDAGLSAKIAADYQIGFELKVVDDDTGGSPEHQLVWNNASGVDESYQRTDDYGSLKLSSTVLDLAVDATLNALTVDAGTLSPDFSSATLAYTVELPYGTTTIPTLSATENDVLATVNVVNATELPGQSIVTVAAEDTAIKSSYVIDFTITAPSIDASLKMLTIADVDLYPDFSSDVYNYTVELPLGSTIIPTISDTVTTDENATMSIENATAIPGATKVTVTAQDGETILEYTISFNLESAATTATLEKLTLSEGLLSPAFNSDSLHYTVNLDFNTTIVPEITTSTVDAKATFTITPATILPGTSKITVLAEDKVTTLEYLIDFVMIDPSVDATLTSLTVNEGVLEPAFSPLHTSYSVALSKSQILPTLVKAQASNSLATLTYTYAKEIPGITKVLVTAQDGKTSTEYEIHMKYAQNNITSLDTIILSNGILSPIFHIDSLNYTVMLPWGTDTIPELFVVATDSNAFAIIEKADTIPGKTTIKVIAEDSVSSRQYIISYVQSLNPGYTLSFKIVDGNSKSLSDAAVYFNGLKVKTGSNGLALFDSISSPSDSNLIVRKKGYHDYKGTVGSIQKDMEMEVKLEMIVGIETQIQGTLKTYPNPSTGNTTLEIPESLLGGTLYVISMQGNEVLVQEVTSINEKIDASSFESGLYFLKVVNENKQSVCKFILH